MGSATIFDDKWHFRVEFEMNRQLFYVYNGSNGLRHLENITKITYQIKWSTIKQKNDDRQRKTIII